MINLHFYIYIIFSFPKNEERRKLWLEAIPTLKLDRRVNNNTKICSVHFKPCAFEKFNNSCRNYLNKDAVPILFDNRTTLQVN